MRLEEKNVNTDLTNKKKQQTSLYLCISSKSMENNDNMAQDVLSNFLLLYAS